MNSENLDVLAGLLHQPTAPFHEQHIVAFVRDWARSLGLEARPDPAGNLRISYRHGRPAATRWVLAAHMDHPGFVVRRRAGRTVQADFIGYVSEDYFPGAAVRLFGAAGEATAIVRAVRKRSDSPWLSCRLELARLCDVRSGDIGMWDLPAIRRRGRRLAGRACDDLAGCAAALCALRQIVQSRLPADLTVLLTRGEEAGFVGALAACRKNSVPRDAVIVTIEASKAQGGAKLGDGAVVRVGDRLSVFDPAATAYLSVVAADLSARDKTFRFVRQLMPGGACESTAYANFGYTTAAVCLPLGNYHNMAAGGRIAPELIDTGDFESLVKLLAALPADRRGLAAPTAALRKRLNTLWRQRREYLK